MIDAPVIPETITVHLGNPGQTAENLRITFTEYVKNVASSEIYPTWPEAAIRANIRAQITYALNRIYTEYYPSQGYDFDITSSTQYDQKFIKGRDVFDNISKIVDDIFNDYIVRQGTVEPIFAQYCDGIAVTCEGLSQWGTVSLANDGLVAYEILQHYYGDNINIHSNTPVAGIQSSYGGVPLRLGNAGEDVRVIQRQLNRIAENYPAIPKLSVIDGVFGLETEAAVREFQQIFNLTVDGIVGKATWYKVKAIYNGIKRLNELESEGLTPEEVDLAFSQTLEEGDTGPEVRLVQYLLAVIGTFDDQIPVLIQDGIFDQNMKDTLIAFQLRHGLAPNGELNRETWNKINEVYAATLAALPSNGMPESSELYPGRFLSLNMAGDDVTDFQRLLKRAAALHPEIPPVEVTGRFDPATENAVRYIQREAGFLQNDAVGPLTWARVVELSKNGGG